MIRLRHKFLIGLTVLFDQICLFICFIASLLLFNSEFRNVNIEVLMDKNVKAENVGGVILMLAFWIYILQRIVRYDENRFMGIWTQIMVLVKGVTACALVLWIASFVFDFETVSNVVIVFFWILSILFTTLCRLALNHILRVRQSGFNTRHILFVGSDDKAVEFAKRIKSKQELGCEIAGFVRTPGHYGKEVKDSGHLILGDLSQFHTLIQDRVIDEIMICLPVKIFFGEIANLLILCQDQGVVARLAPTLHDFDFPTNYQIEQFEDRSIITFFRERLVWQLFWKRVTDLSVSLLLLPFILPLGIVVAILIKKTSAGPIFFIQERVGINKRKFGIIKFRTMHENADAMKDKLMHLNEASGPVFKIRNDPRITPLGRFLRKTSIDELPQIFNVIHGEMSLVGPRPPVPREVEEYDWFDRKRLSVKPGITCLWQISGRSELSFEQWMELDRKYIREWSIWLDINILIKTIPVVLLRKGAQ